MTERDTSASQRFVLITGPSGAGRSTAINVLEDFGYETIDSLPISLISRLLSGPPLDQPMALGIAPATRGFSANAFIEVVDQLSASGKVVPELVYLDARTDVLLRRYSETRRRHPSAPEETPEIGIAREGDLLAPMRARADFLIDTSELTPHDLKAELATWFAPKVGRDLALSLHSFSYKRGLPRGLDMVFDCRFLRNPYWDPALRPHTGLHDDVQAYVTTDDRYTPFFDQVRDLVNLLIPAYREEGKSYLSIGFGCTGGKHRSVTLAEHMAAALAQTGQQVSIRHRELERTVPKSAARVGKEGRT
ncbi:MAG: RNase adapter RapZ [Pseudomonadota bacterium]